MAQAQDLKQAITSVSGRPGPVFSAYLSVNAQLRGGQPPDGGPRPQLLQGTGRAHQGYQLA